MTDMAASEAGLPDLTALSARQLLRLSRETLVELRRREGLTLRTWNPPVGEVAEYLVMTALEGQAAGDASQRDWDLLLKDGRHVQVKALMQNEGTKLRNFSPLRASDASHDCVFVVFDGSTFDVAWARDVPAADLGELYFNTRVNGHVASASKVKSLGRDVTEQLQAVLDQL